MPCVVSGIGGNTDLVGDRLTGRLVTDPTPRAWASTLVELLENRSEAPTAGSGGQERVEEHFALPVVVDHYLEVYRRLIDRRWPDRA